MFMNAMMLLSTTAMIIHLVRTLLEVSIASVILDMKEMGLIAPVSFIFELSLSVLLLWYFCIILDVDECSNDTLNDCSGNASCVDTIGSYSCLCDSGYSGNGRICSGIIVVPAC